MPSINPLDADQQLADHMIRWIERTIPFELTERAYYAMYRALDTYPELVNEGWGRVLSQSDFAY